MKFGLGFIFLSFISFDLHFFWVSRRMMAHSVVTQAGLGWHERGSVLVKGFPNGSVLVLSAV